MNKAMLILSLIIFYGRGLFSQDFTQNIHGQIIDKTTQSPIIGANIVVLDTDPLIGTVSDLSGYYELANVPTGRVSVRVSYLGYESVTMTDLELTSGKELVLNFAIEEKVTSLEEMVVVAGDEKMINLFLPPTIFFTFSTKNQCNFRSLALKLAGRRNLTSVAFSAAIKSNSVFCISCMR